MPLYCDVLPELEPRSQKTKSNFWKIYTSEQPEQPDWGLGFTGIASGESLNKDVKIFLNVRTSKPGEWVLDVIRNEEKYEKRWTLVSNRIFRIDTNESNTISQVISLILFMSILIFFIK